jgi:hypothetical protein
MSVMFFVFAFFAKEAVWCAVTCLTFVTDISNRTFPFMLIFGMRAAAFETNCQFGVTTASFDRVSKAMASITLCEWRVGNELFSGGPLTEKRGRVANHEFQTSTVWVIERPYNTGREFIRG